LRCAPTPPQENSHEPVTTIKVGGASVNFRRDAKTRSRALTPAAVQTFRGTTSRLKETIRSIIMGSTDTDRTVQINNVDRRQHSRQTRQELHLQSCEQPDVVRGGRPLIV
jgi:hypothetical protein